MYNLDFLENDKDTLETSKMPDQKTLKRKTKIELKKVRQREKLIEAITEIPKKGYSYHMVSVGLYDFYTIIPTFVGLLDGIEILYGSTWTMNRDNAIDILSLFDKGLVKEINILTGLYFKRRETAVYSTLLNGLKERKQRFIASKNHTKIILMKKDENYIVTEGSANFTMNPRVEQFVMSNDKELFDFHKSWMEGLFNGR
jgi:hypothetical protein